MWEDIRLELHETDGDLHPVERCVSMAVFSSVEGRTAVVTGATSGIGESIARVFAAQGMRVVLAGRRAEKGERIAKEIRDAGGEALFCRADVSSEDDVERLMRSAVEAYDSLDVFVCNAGASCLMKPVHEYESDDFRRVTDIDYVGVFLCMKHAVRAMLDSGSSNCSIVNISSAEGLKATANFAPYSAAKRAVISLTQTAGMDYARHGIRVNCICPGAIDTDIYATVSPEQRELTQAMIPNGRFGRPEEIANVALFLASDLSSYVTGAVIPVDAAMSSGNFVEVPWEEPDPRG